ncbi:hypothetical protein M9H77_08410 [Catharanthus roseus]|uniref:Uncharacterized protein n=1 Tax=Catharanthus roseus TaxID=4058 RepID=A0ACC0BXV1_CATRO|nr:hypothetical protein M9H77_08410 [Catharanthus roseus]
MSSLMVMKASSLFSDFKIVKKNVFEAKVFKLPRKARLEPFVLYLHRWNPFSLSPSNCSIKLVALVWICLAEIISQRQLRFQEIFWLGFGNPRGEIYEKISQRFKKDLAGWKVFIHILYESIQLGSLEESPKKMPLIEGFNNAMIETYDADWMVEDFSFLQSYAYQTAIVSDMQIRPEPERVFDFVALMVKIYFMIIRGQHDNGLGNQILM